MEVITLQDILQSLKNRAVDGEVRIDVNKQPFEEIGLTVRANKDALISVIQNLIDNAVAAGGQMIQVDTKVERSVAKISISDNGPGIDADVQDQIFEPFFSTKPQGNGLGLAIARSVCRAHSGDLVLETECDEGACFSLILPLIEKDYREAFELKQAF